MYKKEELL